ARNGKETDGRSDIYALGCTLYCMLTGRPPFMGRTIVEVIQAKELGNFPPARQTNINVTERLDLLIAKMAAKQPKYRYQTCDELIKDLEALELAGTGLSFIQQRPLGNEVQEAPVPGKTALIPPMVDSKPDSDEAPAVDPEQWYVQMKMQDGAVVTRKYHTAQLQKMLGDGTIAPNAKISHSPDDGFRSLAT